ncbi:uncharacterized protein LTR77_007056 [Saxophila tyrrhenica]|uniref:Ras modification protein ERF4 n=1 Tax=Saxophila tyrrhenica TaxID=1690608 RepID=A0AAV9P7G0_9PEZI|nr:hypothetical protein LTR77_007056 [Saxophila tyrrhenica]
METFHRLAGMTETHNNQSEHPSYPIPEPPPIPDSETASQYAASTHGSRVSLPLNRRASRKSIRSTKSGKSQNGGIRPPTTHPPLPTTQPQPAQPRISQDSAGSSSEEFAWGPSHPCFPHPNPHCSPDSPEAQSTRVIRVRRDWLQAGDLYPQYANLYPEILDPLVTDEDFRFLISSLNARLKEVFNPHTTRAWLDSVMGVATGFVWDDLGLTGAKRGVRELERWVERWNAEKEREGKEVRVVQLRKTGFMTLDFVVPDPGIDVVDEGGEGGEEEMVGGIGPAE